MDESVAERIGMVNDVLERLTARRVERIVIDGPLAKSKIAWKVATYAEALLYRVVALANGCAVNWNRNDALVSVLAARALVETVAVLMDLDRRLEDLLDKEDLAGINALIMNRSFSTRDEDWLKNYPDAKAVNVLTIIEGVDENHDLEGMLSGYHASLSELCHPNRDGHLGLFGTLDTKTGETTYSVTNYRPLLG
ncbi:MAG TPA: hypothetical protein DCL72_09120, partial [Rhizobiales bacterium]|nr:hypothetical protein [Hyphomicrobiales bacterium]